MFEVGGIMKALFPVEVTPSSMTTEVIDCLKECQGCSNSPDSQVNCFIFPVPEMWRMPEVELKNHFKSSPHVPDSSRLPLPADEIFASVWCPVDISASTAIKQTKANKLFIICAKRKNTEKKKGGQHQNLKI